MDPEEFLHLKRKLEQLKKETARLQGSRDILLTKLQKDFNCSSVLEGKELLAKLKEEIDEKKDYYQERAITIEQELRKKC